MKQSTHEILRGSGLILAALVTIIFTACGSVSGLQGPHGAAVTPARKFSKISVQDFKLAGPEVGEKVNAAKRYFADRIVTELNKTRRFASVGRNVKPDANTLVIDGAITKYDEGSLQKRLWLGMGFGMAFLEATVEFRDSKGMKIGTIKVDKNSWPLGGGLAAGQDPEDFMNGAANKVAEEAVKMAK